MNFEAAAKTCLSKLGSSQIYRQYFVDGGIPQSCLYEYFDQLVQPTVMKDLIDKDEVKAYLSELRTLENKNRELARESLKLKEETKSIAKRASSG